MGKEVGVTCGNPLCVQHVVAESAVYPHRQFYVLRDLGYTELTPRKPVDRSTVPFHTAPQWLSDALRVTRETAENKGFSSDGATPF